MGWHSGAGRALDTCEGSRHARLSVSPRPSVFPGLIREGFLPAFPLSFPVIPRTGQTPEVVKPGGGSLLLILPTHFFSGSTGTSSRSQGQPAPPGQEPAKELPGGSRTRAAPSRCCLQASPSRPSDLSGPRSQPGTRLEGRHTQLRCEG